MGIGRLFCVPQGMVDGEPLGELKQLTLSDNSLEVSPDCEKEGFFSHQIMGNSITMSLAVKNVPEVEDILNGDNNFFDIEVKDNEGKVCQLGRSEVIATPKITRRIPRKMKKALKKRYGDKWMYHHPNADFNVEIKSMEAKK